jgi:hypothetical protein
MSFEPENAGMPGDRTVRPIGDTRDRYVDDPRKKKVLWAAALALMPGLGHIYVGYYRQAFQNILTVCFVILILDSNVLRGIEAPLGLFLAFFWLYNIVDAARRAVLYNQALAGLGTLQLPDDVPFQMPKVGSLAGGVALIVIGSIFFTRTMFGWSLDWVSQWWPAGLVAVGAWLVWEDVKGKFLGASRDGSDVDAAL